MSLCHIYDKVSQSEHIQEFLDAFDNSSSINLSKSDIVDEYNIYLIELEYVSKQITIKLKNIFKDKKHPLVYFILPQKHNLPFFQLAFLLNAKSILTLKHDIHKVISKLKTEYIIHEQEYRSLELGNILVNNSNYMLFKDKKLSYASNSLLKDFDCENLEHVNQRVCSKIDLENLLSNQEGVQQDINKKLDENTTYFLKSIANDDECYISLDNQEDYEKKCPEFSYLSTRLTFIEKLKDNLIESSISGVNCSLITIKLNNINEISQNITRSEVENFRKDMLFEIELILDDKLILSQYDTNCFVAMFKDIEFDSLCSKASNFHLQIARFLNKQNFKTELSVYAFDIKEMDLNSIINTLNNIYKNKVTKKETEKDNLKYIDNYRDKMSEEEIISYLLESAYVNHTKIELVNLYKGMNISSSSEILKKTGDSVYIIFKPVQGAVMSMMKSVVLKSSIFSKDIRANVKYINLREQIAILENFKVLDYDINSRQHGRVSFAKKTMAAISLIGTKVSAEIIDISVYSISFKVKKTKFLENILNKDIGVTFYIPSETSQTGLIKIEESATVIHQSCDVDSNYKLVCIFEENRVNEDILVEYVYKRQMNIISEMKALCS